MAGGCLYHPSLLLKKYGAENRFLLNFWLLYTIIVVLEYITRILTRGVSMWLLYAYTTYIVM